jgi:hypothetical protein
MAKAKSRTTPADGWRQHQLRRRARGKGKHPLPGGRYTPVKRTLRKGVQPRDADRIADALWEACTLSAYHPSGFSWTPEMMAAAKHIADLAPRKTRTACLAAADARERSYIAR